MTVAKHRMSINLAMYHCVAKLLFSAVSWHQKGPGYGFAKNIVLKLYEICASGKLLILMEYHKGVSEISQSYFRNHSENWIEILREHRSWLGVSIFELVSVWPPLVAITALNRRGMLRTRTSIPSGATDHQACNKASRNLTTVIGGLSIYLINSSIWSEMCSMGFRSRLRAGQPHALNLLPP